MTQPKNNVSLLLGEAEQAYATWPTPDVIYADGPYGLGQWAGEPRSPSKLAAWYRAHVAAWTQAATGRTQLWFWGTEASWAAVHSMICEHGWELRNVNVWDKGLEHVAGRTNQAMLRGFPVVTEVCAHYSAMLVTRPLREGGVPLQAWLATEWTRAGLTLAQADKACGVAAAASRKYLAKDHRWYPPPPQAFEAMVALANEEGREGGAPYFTDTSSGEPMTRSTYEKLLPRVSIPFGFSNVWHRKPLRGDETLRRNGRRIHPNQKPVDVTRVILRTAPEGSVLWEPFAGTATACYVGSSLGMRCYGAEKNPLFHQAALARFSVPLQMVMGHADHF